jgi:hypothetical protein
MPKAKKYSHKRHYGRHNRTKRGGEKTPTETLVIETTGLRNRKTKKVTTNYDPFPQSEEEKKATQALDDIMKSKRVNPKIIETIAFPSSNQVDIFEEVDKEKAAKTKAAEENEKWAAAFEGSNMEPWTFDKGGRKSRRNRRKGRKSRKHLKH